MKIHRIQFGMVLLLLWFCQAPAAVFYVDVNSTNPTPPYAGWSTAATNIQNAVAAATNRDTVLVTNGTYSTGGKMGPDGITNVVCVTNAITLQSVNGPGVTFIVGGGMPSLYTPQPATARCVYLGASATLSGFTLTNGYSGFGGGSGGGVFCASADAVVTNCSFVGNSSGRGGGDAGGTLYNCTFTNNAAGAYGGGGASGATLNNCSLSGNQIIAYQVAYFSAAAYGGGAAGCTLNNCIVTGNAASAGSHPAYGGGAYGCTVINSILNGNSCAGSVGEGGGASYCTLTNSVLNGNSCSGDGSVGGGADVSTLNNCRVTGNTAPFLGGGVYSSTLNNCLVSGNTASGSWGGSSGGGAEGGRLINCTIVGNVAITSGGGVAGFANAQTVLTNCIVYGNNAASYPNYVTNVILSYCCTTPLAPGPGNISGDPQFVNAAVGDYHLLGTSPCINAGNNALVTVTNDLDGNPRIRGGTVDIGAYEYQTPSSILSYAWAQQYGLPTDGSADFMDTDGDGMNNWQEWIAGTIPTNAASLLAMLPLKATNNASGIKVSWQSVNTRTYYLQRATNLAAPPAFSAIQSNLVGQAVSTSFTDTAATNGGPYFYRVGVQ